MLDIDVDSLVSQLKNKVSYRLEQTLKGAVNDPEANQYAKEKEELKASVGTVDDIEKIPANLSPVEKILRKIKQIALRVKDRMINIFITFIIPLILAMFVANESVMYPAPVRIIYFIFTFVLCYVNQAAVALLGTVYLGKFVYDYYVNKMEKRGIPLIVPPILAVLPVKVFDPSEPAAFFKDLVNFPLTYPRNERGEKNLLLIMNDYMESLKNSFTYLDNVKSMPMFVEKLKKIDENMEQLHKLTPEPVEKNGENKNGEKPPVSLPPTIVKQREKNGLPPNSSEVEENKKRPVPLTIAQQREKNGLSPLNSNKGSTELTQNSTDVLNTSPQISTPVAAPQETNSSAPPNYNSKETNTASPLPPVIKQKEANSSAPPNYNDKETDTSSPLPPVIKQKETNTSAPPAYNSVPNKGNQSQPKTPKK